MINTFLKDPSDWTLFSIYPLDDGNYDSFLCGVKDETLFYRLKNHKNHELDLVYEQFQLSAVLFKEDPASYGIQEIKDFNAPLCDQFLRHVMIDQNFRENYLSDDDLFYRYHALLNLKSQRHASFDVFHDVDWSHFPVTKENRNSFEVDLSTSKEFTDLVKRLLHVSEIEAKALPFSFEASRLECFITKRDYDHHSIVSHICFEWCIDHQVLTSLNVPVSDLHEAQTLTQTFRNHLNK